MSGKPQSGLHPDADLLGAFAEGVLPEHERLACVAHLAECESCREVVYLVQEPLAPEPVSVPAMAQKAGFWKRWLTPIPALSAAAVAGIAVFSVWLYVHGKPAANAPELVAMVPRGAMAPASIDAQKELAPGSAATPRMIPEAKVRTAPRAAQEANPAPKVQPAQPATADVDVPVPAAALPVSPLPVAPAAEASPVEAVQASRPQATRAEMAVQRPAPPAQTGIAGKITDPTGAAIPGATVRLRLVASSSGNNVTSDRSGQFNVAGIQPGQYELQVLAPGFRQLTKRVDVQPDQMARVDSTLSIGAVSETVEVTAASPRLSTESSLGALAAAKSAPQPLPNKYPTAQTVVGSKVTLATDSAGNLFVSQNAGKKWKAVKPVWQGKVVSLESLPGEGSSSAPAFQLTTDRGAQWLSRDGSRWLATPSAK